MTLDGQPRVCRLHPFPVVLDAHLLLPAELDVDGQPPRASVQGVLDEFLDDRGRTFDNLASGNLVGEIRRQLRDLGQSCPRLNPAPPPKPGKQPHDHGDAHGEHPRELRAFTARHIRGNVTFLPNSPPAASRA